jgi:hypothetical protein
MKQGILDYRALAARVLVVAVGRVDGWTAYCDAVEGEDHDAEAPGVARNGAKLPQSVACLLFPQLDPKEFCR